MQSFLHVSISIYTCSGDGKVQYTVFFGFSITYPLAKPIPQGGAPRYSGEDGTVSRGVEFASRRRGQRGRRPLRISDAFARQGRVSTGASLDGDVPPAAAKARAVNGCDLPLRGGGARSKVAGRRPTTAPRRDRRGRRATQSATGKNTRRTRSRQIMFVS